MTAWDRRRSAARRGAGRYGPRELPNSRQLLRLLRVLRRWRRDPAQGDLIKECERLLADLPVPTPFSVEALVKNMEQVLERRIQLVPFDDPDGGLGTACGLRIKTPEFTIVLYRRRSSRNQTEHIILHELAHEWLDHGSTLTPDEIERYVPEHIQEEVLRRFPSALVQGRVNYDSPEEQQAEMSASLIKRLARRMKFAGDDMVSLLESSLSHPVAPPRQGGHRG
ncbi:MAG TPA: hypothetical protein VN520_31405 [Streptomyces sp.]|uniref:hypothetical protein n=1 Tax=Streptomyces sp. TaxID=1931 RepID=UPI002BDBC279|nr:hypothetical protein [Streptomyces sp.]HWU10810.1 hypothetical protein [Streptomyces sp.]